MPNGGNYGNDQFPLAGVILCCTAIPPEERSKLAEIAIEMGATNKLDLTSDVTHLIVGRIDTPKYNYVAKERPDVAVVTPQWLEAVRTSWLEGGDTDVAALVAEHRMPTFQGLKICVTGFDDLNERHQISETIERNGAEYHGDLTKAVTHLIAATASGKKYQYALNWKIKVVSYEWLEDSVKRTMALEEKYYDPLKPIEERGKGAVNEAANTSIGLGKRSRELEQTKPTAESNARRKLRRSASSRMGSQNESIWADITAGGSLRRKEESDDWTNESLIDSKVVESAAHDTRKSTSMGNDAPDQAGGPSIQPHRVRGLLPRKHGTIFGGRVVFVHGFDNAKSKILRDHLSNNGAEVIRAASDLEDPSFDDLHQGYLVLPHDASFADLPTLPEAAERLCRVTNWWVERCLHGKELIEPSAYALSKPFKRLSIEGFGGLIISSTSFAGIELLHMSKAVKLMGASYDEFLTPTTSVLVCNSRTPNSDKLRYASERNIPAVFTTWLWDCVAAGASLPFDEYLINEIRQSRETKTTKTKPLAEIPTAPLSEEDSAKLFQKQRQQSFQKDAPKVKDRTKRATTLEFAPFNDPTQKSALESYDISNESNYSHESPFAFDHPTTASTPLQEIDPEVNSPHGPSTISLHSNSHTHSTSTGNGSDDSFKLRSASLAPENRPTPDSVVPGNAHQESLNSAIVDLLARKKAASSNLSSATINEKPRPRRRGKLGRATSGTSNPSTAASRTNSLNDVHNAGEGSNLNFDGVGDEKAKEVYQPSQSLLYEGPEVQKTREMMIRQMGGKVEDVSGVVGPIGLVKDVVSEGGGGRLGRRRKI